MVLSLCTNAFVKGSYLRNEGISNVVGMQIRSFSYYFTKEPKSCALMWEIYDEGKLVQSSPFTIGDLVNSGGSLNEIPRKGTLRYTLNMRLLPPLVITKDEIDAGLAILKQTLS